LLIGKYFLREEVGKRRVLASVVGFAGSLLVIQPAFMSVGLYALFPLMCALFFALYMMITRELSREVHPVSMQFLTAFIAAILCVPLLLAGSEMGVEAMSFARPEGVALLWCGLVGVAGTTAHMFMTYALRFAPSSTLAPVQYLEMVTATLFGYLVFGNFPNALTWVGIAIIVASGLYVIHRERMIERAARHKFPH
jgi:drug/metabolite transporter (DMT)-like permease